MMRVWIGLLGFVLFFISCSKDEENGVEDTTPPEFVSCSYQDALNMSAGNLTIEVFYDQNVILVMPHGITINGNAVNSATAMLTKLSIGVTLELNNTYALVIPANVVKGPDGSTAEEVTINFATKASPQEGLDATLSVDNPSQQAKNVYKFLCDNYGVKVISATMSNVSWNINEAEWVKQHTGKYPAMATLDYIHLPSSPANWIDYSQTTFIEEWWNNNGLVSAGWHWIVPSYQGSTTYVYKPNETTFNAANATVEGTWENDVVKADLAKMAGYLKLLKDKNIPVIWRPLHEAAGNIYEYNGGTAWFWWGYKGATAYKNLWIYMFNYFESQGLNNLIWVWTTQTKDSDFYPGDNYVDIIGRDLYDNGSASTIFTQFETIQNAYPNKMVTLSECGNVAKISAQWQAGAQWSYFMPWYDYDRTKDMASADFTSTAHVHADAAWWTDAFGCSYVITRDQMPSLK